MGGRWRIEVDRDTCIGSGMCTGIAPGHFTLVGGHSSVIDSITDPDEAVIDAAESCPVEAILVRAAADGMVVAPEQ